MDWGYKAMLTTVTVAIVLTVARTLGRRVAGVLAGLPVITAPAPVWIAVDHGAVFAACTAAGSIAASGVLAIFALAYERLSRRVGAMLTMMGSVAVLSIAAWVTAMAPWTDQPMPAAVLAVAVCSAALTLIPSGVSRVNGTVQLKGEVVLTSSAAGVISVGVSLGAGELGPFVAGLLVSLPVISGAVLVNQHLTATTTELRQFLRGYITGLLGKAIFALVFAMMVVQHGVAQATGVAMAISLLAGLLLARTFSVIQRRPAPASVRQD